MVGFFDSGIGGLSVLAKAIEYGLSGDVVYLGDEDNAPYGDKKKEEIVEIVSSNCQRLSSFGCNKIVCACNTASVATRGISFNIPFSRLSLPPLRGLRDALYLATAYSVANSKEIEKEGIETLPLPRLATLIDEDASKDEIENYLRSASKGLKRKTLILGCTHYSFVKDSLKKVIENEDFLDVGNSVKNADVYRDDAPLRVFFLPRQYKKYSLALNRLLGERVDTFPLT